MIHPSFLTILAFFAHTTALAQTLWAEENTSFDLYFEPLELIAVNQQEIQLAPPVNENAGFPAFTDSLSTAFYLRYTISPVQPNTQLIHRASLPDGLSSSWNALPFLPASGTCTLAPSAKHTGTNQFLASTVYGHSGTALHDGIPVVLRIGLNDKKYQYLAANTHWLNLTYQCL